MTSWFCGSQSAGPAIEVNIVPLSWLKEVLFPKFDYRLHYALMPDWELAAVKRKGLNEEERKCYDDEVFFRKQYADMPDEEFSAINRDDIADVALRCYETEAKRRSKVGDFIVNVVRNGQENVGYLESRLTGKNQATDVAPLAWPRRCARCDAPEVSNYYCIRASYKFASRQFSMNLSVPVCAACYPSRDTTFLESSSTGTTQSVEHVFKFANHAYGVRFKTANSPVFPCSKCNQGVGNSFCGHGQDFHSR